MPKESQNIPFVNEQTDKASFFMRPVMREIDAFVLDEKPHRHNFQEIIWLKSGHGTHTIDDKIIHLKPHTFYFISQGQVHQFLEGHHLEGCLIRFRNDFLPFSKKMLPSTSYTLLLSKINNINEITLAESEVNRFELVLNMLFYEYQNEAEQDADISVLQHLLLVLLKFLERKSREKAHLSLAQMGQENHLYISFLHLLEEQYFKTHDISSYAQQLGVLKRKLAETVLQISGKSPKQLINERNMLEAKRLLLYTDSLLKEITYNLGYEDPAYFCRVFKNFTGFTPNEFRKKER